MGEAYFVSVLPLTFLLLFVKYPLEFRRSPYTAKSR